MNLNEMKITLALVTHNRARAINFGSDYVCAGCRELLRSNSRQAMAEHQAREIVKALGEGE